KVGSPFLPQADAVRAAASARSNREARQDRRRVGPAGRLMSATLLCQPGSRRGDRLSHAYRRGVAEARAARHRALGIEHGEDRLVEPRLELAHLRKVEAGEVAALL